jgi:hypothetical protein
MTAVVCKVCGPIEIHYYRSTNGEIVHRGDCARRGSKSVPWHYATTQLDGNHDRVLGEIADVSWLRACKFCMGAES